MKYTKYNNLNVPDLTDQYNLKHWNENTEKIDDKLNEHQKKLDASTPETTASTIMMRNEQGKVKVTTPLEQDDTNMAVNIDYLMNAFRTKMLNEAHPKGDYYWTDDKNFDPNVSWVGTWVRVEDTFIYAIKESETAGVAGGSKKITVANLPSHNHSFSDSGNTDYSGSHSHSLWAADNDGQEQCWGLGYRGFDQGIGGPARTEASNKYISTSNNGHAYVASNGSHSHSFSVSGTTGSAGSGTDYMPPYVGAYCWHRTE